MLKTVSCGLVSNGVLSRIMFYIFWDLLPSCTKESDGGCEGSDAEMIGNGRRERDTEDEDEGREERSSEGGGGGGFGGWRSHLLGGLTQRVKSWYWGARPLVSSTFRNFRTITFFFNFRILRAIFSFISYFFFFYSYNFLLISRIFHGPHASGEKIGTVKGIRKMEKIEEIYLKFLRKKMV